MDPIERRVAWQTISLSVTFAFAASGSFAYDNARIGGWELAFLIVVLACLGGAAVLLVAAVAPAAVTQFTGDQRERFVFYAFALWVLALLVIVGFSAHAAIGAHRHPLSLG
jgi:hypothetical protein